MSPALQRWESGPRNCSQKSRRDDGTIKAISTEQREGWDCPIHDPHSHLHADWSLSVRPSFGKCLGDYALIENELFPPRSFSDDSVRL